jgi:oxepin-CoA hydrolase / 3-oxo-5,6-dehydrosuberyl-CoA semialdehyde dehydrogenase
MNKTRFDVNDADRREGFLRHEVVSALAGLSDDAVPRWGRMTAQQMVEHLIWAFELSTGQAECACFVPLGDLPRVKTFLYHNRPTAPEFRNPALVSGLPPLRFASLAEARAALGRELGSFLEETSRGDRQHTHPIFGPIGHEEWHRVHYKHTQHHLLQFGLIEPE